MMRSAAQSLRFTRLMPLGAILLCGLSSALARAPLPAMSTPSLAFSVLLGGSQPCPGCTGAHTFAQNCASDANGNLYVTGATTVADLPVPGAWQPEPARESALSAFVAKYGPTGALLWCTYLGGKNQSIGLGIAAMPDGGVAVVGATSSDGSLPFPTLNAFQDHNNGETDYFISVFDAGGALRYSTYLGGSGMEGGPGEVFVDDGSNGNNIAADAKGLVYVTGVTPSGSGEAVPFPVTPNALQPGLHGPTDAFLCIVDPSKAGASSLLYSSFLGGNLGEQGHSVTVNAKGTRVTVGGYTRSTDFPTTANAYRSQSAPDGYLSNGFVCQFKSSKPGAPSSKYTIRYCTYLGGDTVESRDDVYAMAAGPDGVLFIAGRTQSPGFPMRGPSKRSIYNSAPYLKAGTPPDESGDEPYFAKIDPSLEGKASLVYSTYLGGGEATAQWGSYATGVGVDSKGNAYLGAQTTAYEGKLYTPASHGVEAPQEFPYTADALFAENQGSYDAALMQVSPNGAKLTYSTYFGGTESDHAFGLSVDPSGNIFLTGAADSRDFPVKPSGQPWPGGAQSAFIAKFSTSANAAAGR
jgi:hypothetical protein